MTRWFLAFCLVLAVAVTACSSDSNEDQEEGSIRGQNVVRTDQNGTPYVYPDESVDEVSDPVENTDQQVSDSESSGSAGPVCPERGGWSGELPELAAVATICFNTERSLVFGAIEISEINSDKVYVVIHATEYGCSQCPREVECDHYVTYKRQESIWEADDIASDNCELSQESVEATAITHEQSEKQRIEQLVNSYQIQIHSAHAERTYRGIEVLMSQTPVEFEPGIGLKGIGIYEGKEYELFKVYYDDSSDGIQLLGFEGGSPDSGLGSNDGVTILSVQVYWTEGYCKDGCELPDYYGPVFTP